MDLKLSSAKEKWYWNFKNLKYLALINIFKNYMFIKLLICKGSVTKCLVYIVLDRFVIFKGVK